tara:strand:+ start:2095 stop:2433 length:339 start_codon:yes stop_codon:yes gene_type:complete
MTLILIFFIITYFYSLFFYRKLKIFKAINIYIDSIKELSEIEKAQNKKIIFDKISKSGFLLLLKFFILVLPCVLFFIIFQVQNINLIQSLLISSSPYILFFISNFIWKSIKD